MPVSDDLQDMVDKMKAKHHRQAIMGMILLPILLVLIGGYVYYTIDMGIECTKIGGVLVRDYIGFPVCLNR